MENYVRFVDVSLIIALIKASQMTVLHIPVVNDGFPAGELLL